MSNQAPDKIASMQAVREAEHRRIAEATRPFRRRERKQYSQEAKAEILDEVFTRLAEGESLNLICDDEHLPTKETISEWMSLEHELMRRYEALAPVRAMALFELALWEVQRASCPKTMAMAVQRSNVYLRAAALLDPAKYSDKTHTQLGKLGSGQAVSIILNIGGTQEVQKGMLTTVDG